MKKIDSQALGILNKSLGLSGAGSPVTELTDGVVDQVLDVAPIVRRSRTLAGSGGLFVAVFENDHAAADNRTTSIFPYNAGTGNVLPPYPSPMPAQFDVWLLTAGMIRIAGSGTVTGNLSLLMPSAQQGIGVDDAGAATGIVAMLTPLVFWDTVLAGSIIAQRNLGVQAQIGQRLPASPATELRLFTTASAAAIYHCFAVLGVFPVGLGVDGLVGSNI